MKVRTLAAVSGLAMAGTAAVSVSASTATAAPIGDGSSLVSATSYDRALTSYVMKRDGRSEPDARAYLQRKSTRQASLTGLQKRGVKTDGAYFDGEKLVVIVKDDNGARQAKASGLVAKKGAGQSTLDARSRSVLATVGSQRSALLTVGSDLRSGTVQVRVAKNAPASLVARLRSMDGVSVTTGTPLTTHADVYPGRIMDLVPGTNCSLGYPGKTSNGNNVLLTAGHCVEGLPAIYDAAGNHIGKGTNTRFRTGYSSVDMGLMDIDSEDVGRPYVDSRGHSGYYAVKGMSKNAVGSEICKAGNTTGWTCGQIKAYNRTVNYGGTYVSGLAEATVCTEGGDSGGAYIGVGNLAQGMTSGGPMGVECGYNRGHAAGSYSFYQPVVDAASYYGVRIDVAS